MQQGNLFGRYRCRGSTTSKSSSYGYLLDALQSGIDLNLANCDSLGVGSCEDTRNCGANILALM